MYQIDHQAVREQLKMLELCAKVLHEVDEPREDGSPVLTAFSAARASHIAMECVMDVGIRLIDALHLRDPGGYQDVVDILVEAKILPVTLANSLSFQVTHRQKLVREYATVSLVSMMEDHFPVALCQEVSCAYQSVLDRLAAGERV